MYRGLQVWDEELARIAQRHADQCKFAHDCSDCRRTERFGVGQNLYIYKQTQAAASTDWDRAVTDWYDEVELFSNKHVKPFQFSSPTGHYTQVVWAETTKVGCGAATYRDGKWFATLYTCNYGPNGNFIRSEMYRAGPACSACPTGTQCSKQFPGLCESPLSLPSNISAAANPPVPAFTRRTTLAPTKKPTRKPTKPTRATSKPIRTTKKPVRTTKKPIITTKKPRVEVKQLTTIRPVSSVFRVMDTAGDNNTLFTCDFNNEQSCNIKNRGKEWREMVAGGNRYRAVELGRQENAEFYFRKLISPPASSLACLDFRFRKFSRGGGQHILTVLAWPNRGKPGKVSIVQNSPDRRTWVRAQVTFKNVDRSFLLMFRARGPGRGPPLSLAVDSVRVQGGRCEQ